MNNSAITPLVTAVQTALKADATLLSMCPYIYTKVPNDLSYPHLELGDCTESMPSWDTMGVKGHELTLSINIYTQNLQNTQVTSLLISNRVAYTLMGSALTVPGYENNGVLFEFNQPVPDLSGANKLIHVSSRYRFFLTEA